ncbi:MAG TPA: hypothetical protein VK638_35405 [Edaphobacter sp.]|jgi:hypothetical protein|nr:hypothetical protein [Edaphobacter sp.]
MASEAREGWNPAELQDQPEEAYFVKCDRTTMTQNDIDVNSRPTG